MCSGLSITTGHPPTEHMSIAMNDNLAQNFSIIL